MKAIMDGVEIEGTPEEINQLMAMRNKRESEEIMKTKKSYPTAWTGAWCGIYPPTGCDSINVTYQGPEIQVKNDADIENIAKALSEMVETASRS